MWVTRLPWFYCGCPPPCAWASWCWCHIELRWSALNDSSAFLLLLDVEFLDVELVELGHLVGPLLLGLVLDGVVDVHDDLVVVGLLLQSELALHVDVLLEHPDLHVLFYESLVLDGALFEHLLELALQLEQLDFERFDLLLLWLQRRTHLGSAEGHDVPVLLQLHHFRLEVSQFLVFQTQSHVPFLKVLLQLIDFTVRRLK